ncbi:flagellar biosynthetic protein FliR [Lachnobacterium bovis]|uniref:Flagellar biosynthetic protein FliR n=1 Tax=Lachnobacterium bovis TaxID=140626 RepID=A0A1H9Q6L3_9FIRM|nr:flagellar biosynthetic protein FliR [Lachnobacterium bovis]SER55549.1 flagellar biosynthetic protein FliR [Lachnobacterium bovis]
MVTYNVTLADVEKFILILVRIASFLVVAPLIGGRDIPNKVKVGFALALSVFLIPLVDAQAYKSKDIFEYSTCIILEVLVGLFIGYAAYICTFIVVLAGNIIDMDIGLSMATEFNPMTNSQVTISGNMYLYFVTLIMIASNMHIYIVGAIIDSFKLIPLGGAVFHWDHLLKAMIRYMCEACVIGFRIFLPFFACIMILNCVLGIMAKVAPQMNMFAVGIQMKLLVGLIVMFLIVFLLPDVTEFIMDEMRIMIKLFVEGMQPKT